MLTADIGAITKRFSSTILSDPNVVQYATGVSVWGRWFVWLVIVVQFIYRPGFWYYEGTSNTSSCMCPWSRSIAWSTTGS